MHVNESALLAELAALARAAVRRLADDPPLLVVRGAGALAALHRLVSQDVARLERGAATSALLLSPKGKCRFPLVVGKLEDEVVLLVPEASTSAVRDTLGRYLALSRLAVDPLFPAGRAAEILGPAWQHALAAAGMAPGAEEVWPTVADGSRLVTVARTVEGWPGATVVADTSSVLDAFLGRLAAQGIREVGADAAEVARIVAGVPRWGREITGAVLPQEVGLGDGWVSLSKGCYPGQETMARLRTYGHVNRTLAGLRQVEGAAAPPPLPLELREGTTGATRGVLTSWAWHPELGGVGLGVVRREVPAGGYLGGDRRLFQVVSLPFLP